MSKSTTALLLTLASALALSACSQEPAAPGAEADETTASVMSESKPHPVPTAPAGNVDLSGIEKAEDGKTIAEIFAEKDQLEGEAVVFRGKVVKVNAGIMGKNWLHVRDGSGEEGTNDLTVTTVDVVPKVGDTVLVAGPVGLNVDFGMGYEYDVIIEDAEVTVE